MTETAVSHIMNFVTSKDRVQAFEDQVVSSVKDGITNPLEIHIYLKAFMKAAEGILKRIADDSLREAEKHGRSSEVHGARVEVCELATRYDYTNCCDKKWETFDRIIKNISEEKKDRESFLKTIKDKLTLVDEDTGEVSEIFPPIKTSTTGIKITIK